MLERQYLAIVGARYAELDEIESKIAEVLASRYPQDPEVQEQAARAKTQAEESARAAGEFKDYSKKEKFEPSENLRKLYREIAKTIHPDLTTDEEERARRTQLMAEVNRAYEEGDEERLEEILREWEASPEAIEGESVGARLVRTIRKIAQVEARLQAIQKEIHALQESDLFELKIKVEAAAKEGRDLFEEMVAQLDKQIEDARKRLAEVMM